MLVNIYESFLYYIHIMLPTCFSHTSKVFVICPLCCTSLRMATGVAEACRRHTMYINIRTLECLYAFVGFITISKQAFFVQILTHTFKRSESKYLLYLRSDALLAVFGVGCYMNQQLVFYVLLHLFSSKISPSPVKC
jgi:hypothetical protein